MTSILQSQACPGARVSPQMGWAECRAATAAQGKAFPFRNSLSQMAASASFIFT
jgi:hypothetical protein